MHETLGKIQAELKVPKNRRNNFGKYNYRNADDILEAVKPLCAKYECVLTLSDEVVEVGGRNYVKATVKIIDKSSFKAEATGWAREAEKQAGMADAQITGSTSSYARKYALNGLFAIDDEQDADATNTHDKAPNMSTETALAKLGACATLEELKTVFASLSSAMKADAEVLAMKDERKIKLS